MFSLIVTLISIALVAALALASLYYGGPVFNQGAARAHAAKIAAQGQQIQGAAELYKADTGEYPISLAELVTKDYLKSIPVAAAQEQVLLNNALAASSWVMVAPKTPVFALTGVTEAVCKAINLGSYGVEGILKTARETNRVQCYGTDLNNLMIVQAKAPADLVAASTNPAAVISVGTVLAAPVPAANSTDTSNAGWLVAPGAGTPVVTPPASPQLSYWESALQVTTLSFPSTTVGSASTKTIELKNTGNTAATLNTPALSAAAPFSIDSTTCNGAVLAANSTCSVTVKFAPLAAGTVSGASYSLNVLSANASPAALGLSGTGEATSIQTVVFMDEQNNIVTNAAYSFGRYQAFGFDNSLSGFSPFTLLNSGATPITLSSLPVQSLPFVEAVPPFAANASPLAIDAGYCSNITLAPGEGCTFYVGYTAWNVGQFSTNLAVTATTGVVANFPITLNVSSTPSATRVECGSDGNGNWVYLWDTYLYGGYAHTGESCI